MNKKARTMIETSILILLVFTFFISFVFAETIEYNEETIANSEDKIINFSSLNLLNRALTSNTYYDENQNQYVAQIFSQPINYHNGTDFRPIDTTVIELNKEGYKFGVESGVYQVYFKENSKTEENIKIINDGNIILFSPKSLRFTGQTTANKKDASVALEKNIAIYKDQFEKIDLKYKYQKARLKEELIIDSLFDLKEIKGSPLDSDDLIFTTQITTFNNKTKNPLDMKINNEKIYLDSLIEIETMGSIGFLNEEENIFSFSKPIAFDSVGDRINLKYIIKKDSSENLILEIYTPYSWLENAIYPVTIDPTFQEDASWSNYIQHDLWDDGVYGNNQNDDLYHLGSDERTSGTRCTYGEVEFPTEDIPDDATITDSDLYAYVYSVNVDDCTDVDLDLYGYSGAELPHTLPDTLTELNELKTFFHAWDFDVGYFSGLDDDDENTWLHEDLDLDDGDYIIQDIIDYDGNSFGVFMEDTSCSSSTDDCYVSIDTETGGEEAYIIVTYTLPDTTAPTTSASATSPLGGSSYTFGTVTSSNVSVTLSCSDGWRGCKIGYPRYCLDTSDTCSSLTTYSSSVDISTGGISYIRYQSKDDTNNTETIKSKIIIIDKGYIQNISISVNNTEILSYSDYFVRTETINNLTQEINNALDSCVADEEGYCDIPITIHSDSSGNLNITDINIYFNITEYVWNVSGLPELSTYKARVKATDGLLNNSWDEGDEDFTIGDVSASNINLDLVYPTTNINVTQNEFFNFTAQVCCYGSNCGEVNVSLDPETHDYTKSAETHCKNGLCTKTIYSGIRFVYEDDNWKKVEEARSLKDKGFDIKYIDIDEKYKLKIIDFNFSSIEFELELTEDELEKDIPVKLWKINDEKSTDDKIIKRSYKDYYDTVKHKKIKQSSKKKLYVEEIGLDKIIEIGGHSTTITLEEADTENLEDTYVDEGDDSNFGSANGFRVGETYSDKKDAYLKFNISTMPSSFEVISANLFLCAVGMGYQSNKFMNVKVFDANSSNWIEEDMNWSNRVGYRSFFNSSNYQYFTDNSDYIWYNWSVENILQEYSGVGEESFSFVLSSYNHSGGVLYMTFASKEFSSSSYRPYLNITYTESLKGLISTVQGTIPFYTNTSNPYNISLNEGQCQNITWWVNATGETNTYTFFVFANKTSDMSIGNKTSNVNITIDGKESPSRIEIDLIYPIVNINVTQNEFFNISVNISCKDADCGEINVSLDPEKHEYTRSTETHCKNGLCTKTLYSGIRFVYEDSQWKKVEEAKSLKGIWKVTKYEDFNFPVEVIDFNYTSITLDLSVSDEKVNQDIDLKIYSNFNKTEKPQDKFGVIKNKDKKIKINDTNKKYRAIIDLSDTRESILGQEIKWGDHSTTIILQDNISENLGDAYTTNFFGESVNHGNESKLIIREHWSPKYVSYIMFNTSMLSNISLEVASLVLTVDQSYYQGVNVSLRENNNHTWNESEITWINRPQSLANYPWATGTILDSINITSKISGEVFIWNISSSWVESQMNNYDEISFILSPDTNIAWDNNLAFASKENGIISYRPYLNITYMEGAIAKDGLVSTITGTIPFYTNESNPRTISLYKDQSELVTFWINATGDVSNTYEFFAFANKTSDMSISNITSKWNVTIQEGGTSFPNDPSKFYIKNSIGDTVAWFGNQGNIVLTGNCFSLASCQTSSDSFIIGNKTDDTLAYINATGDLCIEKGDCSSSASCFDISLFEMKNTTGGIVSSIDYDGDLCYTGGLYENEEL